MEETAKAMTDYRCILCADVLPDDNGLAYSANGVEVAGLLADDLIPAPSDGGQPRVYCGRCNDLD